MRGEGKRFIKCQICGKRLGTKQCDMPIIRGKSLHLKNENGSTDYKNSFKGYVYTCDAIACDRCAVSMGSDIDICLNCVNKVQKIVKECAEG